MAGVLFLLIRVRERPDPSMKVRRRKVLCQVLGNQPGEAWMREAVLIAS